MMRWHLAFLLLTGLLLAACGEGSALDLDGLGSRPVETATPTPQGTWEAVVVGLIYDDATGPGKPIKNASVRYVVISTYFPELHEGRPNVTRSNALGEFSLPVVVHDTDSIKLVVEVEGFQPYEAEIVAIHLVGRKHFDIGLTALE